MYLLIYNIPQVFLWAAKANMNAVYIESAADGQFSHLFAVQAGYTLHYILT